MTESDGWNLNVQVAVKNNIDVFYFAVVFRLGQGDLCLILIDQVDEALAHLRAKVAAG